VVNMMERKLKLKYRNEFTKNQELLGNSICWETMICGYRYSSTFLIQLFAFLIDNIHRWIV